jgi:hypothetical protein
MAKIMQRIEEATCFKKGCTRKVQYLVKHNGFCWNYYGLYCIYHAEDIMRR